MTDMSLPKIEPLETLEVTHVAIYRNAFGVVTAKRILFMPQAMPREVNEEAYRLKGSLDCYCDVFELDHADRIGGWEFRGQQG